MSEKLTRKCVKCREEKQICDFPLNGRFESGRDVRCTSCVREHREMFESACIEKFNRRRYAKP